MDIITDRRITQEEAGRLMAPLELDLLSAFKVIQEDILTGMENYKGTPEQYIEEVLNNLSGIGEVGEMTVLKGKALPVGTRRQRSDGVYIKQSDGTWVKETEKKEKIKHVIPENVHSETKKQVIEAYNKIKSDYKGLLEGVKLNLNKKGGTGGEYNHETREVEINNYLSTKQPEIFDDGDFSLVSNAHDIVIHEMGHAIFNILRDEKKEDFLKLVESLKLVRFQGPSKYSKSGIGELFSESLLEMYKNYEKLSKPAQIVNNFMKKFRNKVVKDVTIMKAKIEKTCKPRGGEKQNDFISRCIKEEMNKGTSQDQAQGKCYGIWRGEKIKKSIYKGLSKVLKSIIKRVK